MSPLSVQIQRFVHSIASSFETGAALPDLPSPPSPLELRMLGVAEARDEEAP
ncbi:hypothetical protein D3C80_2143290 [compost metagenome]